MVIATVTDPNYQGSTSGTLIIQPRQFALTVVASPLEGGSVTGGGTFVEGTPTPITAAPAEGWQFTGWSGTGIADSTSANTTISINGNKTATALFEQLTPYQIWTANNTLNGSDANTTADSDDDGIPNLVEFATHMDPSVSDIVPASASKNTTDIVFVYTFNKAATDVTLTVEWSDDLSQSSWSSAGVSAPTILSEDAETRQLQVTVPAPAGTTHRFVHLRVTRP